MKLATLALGLAVIGFVLWEEIQSRRAVRVFHRALDADAFWRRWDGVRAGA